jgi:probable F420-dependent oxidoreductase
VERDPITTAKEVASLDVLSGGRFLFGVGAGWNREEMENHGTDPGRRFSLMRERIEAMKAIWTEDEAEYHGEHVDFDPIWAWPKPAQKPHPPILVGGNGERVLDRVAKYGDEWMPNVARDDIDNLARRIGELQEKASAAGRGAIPVSGFAAPHDPDTVKRLGEAGFSRLFWYVPPEPRDKVAARIERYAKLASELATA